MRLRVPAILVLSILIPPCGGAATASFAADTAADPAALAAATEGNAFMTAAGAPGARASINAFVPDPSAPPRGEVLVRFRPDASERERASAHARSGMLGGRRLTRSGWEKALAGPGVDLRRAAERYRQDPAVEHAELVLARRITTAPNDLLGSQWGLHNNGSPLFGFVPVADADIDAPEAWDLSTGSKFITVAVLDTGIDSTLGDLSSRLVGGRDFVNGDATPQDDNGHGTAVASVIGAIGNNGRGMTGVNWIVGLMPVKVCDQDGFCDPSDILEGIDFAVANGADVINMSFACDENANATWGCPGLPAGFCLSQAEKLTIEDALAAGVVVVEAAGNCGASVDDSTKAYPCAHDLDGNICAGASDLEDLRAPFSNAGAGTVDVGAPGTFIVVTLPTPPGGLLDVHGTSFASPMVAGVAALLLSRSELTPAEVQRRLVEEGDPGDGLEVHFDGGRVNAYEAIREVFLRGLAYATHVSGDVMLLADVTGDGRADLVRGTAGTGFEIAKNNGKKRKFAAMNLRSTTPPDTFAGAGDANADGREDLILGGASGFRVLRSRNTKGALFPVESWSTEPLGTFAMAGDVNGDFMTDVVNFDGTEFDVLLSTGTAFAAVQQGWSSEAPGTFPALADATGDGRADLVFWTSGGSATDIEVAASTGSAFAPSTTWIGNSREYDFAAAGDFDGDGDDDLAGVDASSGCIAVFIAAGGSFEDPRTWNCPGVGSHVLAGFADRSNDALEDLVVHVAATGTWRMLQADP